MVTLYSQRTWGTLNFCLPFFLPELLRRWESGESEAGAEDERLSPLFPLPPPLSLRSSWLPWWNAFLSFLRQKLHLFHPLQ